MNTEHLEMPQSAESEKAVLGAILINYSEVLDRCIELITEESFYQRGHKIIFKAFLEMHSKGLPIDLLTVSEHLKTQGLLDEAGGRLGLSKMAGHNPSSAHYEHFCEIINEKLRLRRVIEFSEDSKSKAYLADSSKELIPEMEATLFSISSDSVKDENLTEKAVDDLDLQVESRLEGRKAFGIETGIPSFDRISGGLMPGRYYALGALQKVGKTALACQMALNIILNKIPVLFISLELSRDRLLGRMACTNSGINYCKFLNNSLSKEELLKFRDSYRFIAKHPLIIERPIDITGSQIRSMIRKNKRKNGIELVVIDYIQNVSIKDGDVRRSIADASTCIRNGAQETGVAAITLCQLNRSATKERPRMHHLRESSQIESDADTIIILFPKLDKEDLQPNELVPMIMAFDANRDGPSCDQELLYDGTCYKFKELERRHL